MCPRLFQPGVHAGAGSADAEDDALLVSPSELLRVVQRINEIFERLGLTEKLPRGAAKIGLPRSIFEADEPARQPFGGSFAYDSRHVAQNAFIVGNLVVEELLPVTTTASHCDDIAAQQLHVPTYTDEEYAAASSSTELRHNWTREQTDSLFALARSAIGQQRQGGEQSDPISRAAGQWLEHHPQLSLAESEVRGRFYSFSAKLARARSQRAAAPDLAPQPERGVFDRPPKQRLEPIAFNLRLSSTDTSLMAKDVSVSVSISAATVRQLCRSVERALGCSDRLALLRTDTSGEETLVCEASGGVRALPHNATLSVCRAASYTSSDACPAQRQTTAGAAACVSDSTNGASVSGSCGHVLDEGGTSASGAAAVEMEPARLPVFVELGAGRGGLSFAIGVVGKRAVSHILLDRASPRNKFDKFHPCRLQITVDHAGYAHTAPHMPSPTTSASSAASPIGGARSFLARAKMDLRDVWLPALPVLRSAHVVGVAKHLCGSATDYALRALFSSTSHPAHGSGGGEGGGESGGDAGGVAAAAAGFHVRGVAIATCCHHRCDARSYINMPWLAAQGLSVRDFALMRKLAAWATSDAHASAGTAHTNSPPPADDCASASDSTCCEPAAPSLQTGSGSRVSGEPLDLDAMGAPAESDTASARATEPWAGGGNANADEAVEFRRVTEGAAFPLNRAQKTAIGMRVCAPTVSVCA